MTSKTIAMSVLRPRRHAVGVPGGGEPQLGNVFDVPAQGPALGDGEAQRPPADDGSGSSPIRKASHPPAMRSASGIEALYEPSALITLQKATSSSGWATSIRAVAGHGGPHRTFRDGGDILDRTWQGRDVVHRQRFPAAHPTAQNHSRHGRDRTTSRPATSICARSQPMPASRATGTCARGRGQGNRVTESTGSEAAVPRAEKACPRAPRWSLPSSTCSWSA